jgi:hypothetical protein
MGFAYATFTDAQGRAAVPPRWHPGRAALAAVSVAAVVGVPTDVVGTGYFTRMTPVRWWDYLVLGAAVALAAAAAAIGTVPRCRARGGAAGVLGAALAVGCPLCNKVVLALLGTGGALTVWAPAQSALAAASLAALAATVAIRWRGRERAAGPSTGVLRPAGS